MATLTVQQVTRLGAAVTLGAAAGGGDSFAPSCDTFLVVANGSGGAITVTVATPRDVPGLSDVATGDVAVSVPAAATRYIGPFPYEHFAQADDGLADITYSGVTSLTIAAVKLKKP